METSKTTNQNQEEISSLNFELNEGQKNVIVKFLAKVQNKEVTKEDVKNFVGFIMHTYKDIINPNHKIKMPKIEFADTDIDVFGSYFSEENKITINEKLVEKLYGKNGLKNAFFLIDVISHEMTHWMQDDILKKLDDMPESEKSEISGYINEVIIPYEHYLNTDMYELKNFHQSLKTFEDENKKLSNGKYDCFASAIYYSNKAEENARRLASDFVSVMFSEIQGLLSEQDIDKVLNYLENYKKKEQNHLEKAKKTLQKNIEKFKINVDKIKEIEDLFIKKPHYIPLDRTERFYKLVGMIINELSMEEKMELCKSALQLKNPNLLNVVLDAISVDPVFIQNKGLYQDDILNIVTEGENKYFRYDYSKGILDSKQINDKFYKLVDDNRIRHAISFLGHQKGAKITFSNEEISKLDKTIHSYENPEEFRNLDDFYLALLKNKPFVEKTKMLNESIEKSDKLTKFLINSIISDKEYKDTSYVNKKAIELQIAKIGYQDYYNSLNDKNSTNVNIDIDER